MIRYVIKRILLMVPIMIGVSFIVFTILNIVPGDPARAMLGEGALQEDVDALNHELGLDQPFFVRYFTFLKDVFTRFDFGDSYKTGQPVLNDVMARIPVSATLAILATISSALIGIPLGILSAVKEYSMFDTISRMVSIFLASVPAFWLSMLLIFFCALELGVLPSSGVAT